MWSYTSTPPLDRRGLFLGELYLYLYMSVSREYKHAFEMCAILEHHAVYSGNSVRMFREKIVPIFKNKVFFCIF